MILILKQNLALSLIVFTLAGVPVNAEAEPSPVATETPKTSPAPPAPVPQPETETAQVIYTPFEQALIYVYQKHPQLAAERDQLKILDERVSQAVAGYRPSLTANAGTGEQRESVDGQPWVYGDSTNASLVLTQPLLTFGTLAQRRAADARVEAGREHLTETEQTVLLSAITAWLDVCEKERIYRLTEENVQRMQKYHAATNERFKLGEATSTDLAQSESRLAEAQGHLALAQADREIAYALYKRDVGYGLPRSIEFPALPQNVPLSREETIQLARQNPALAEAQHAEDAADHDIDVASSAMWPSIFLRGSTSEEHSPALGLERQRDDSITINVSMPLYQGGAEYSRVREAKLARAKVKQESINAWSDILQKANQAWSNYAAARTIIAASEKGSQAAYKMLGGIQEEQRQGTRTLTEVLDSEAEYYTALVTQTQAQKNLRLESYRLLASVGRLTASGLQLNVQHYDPTIHYKETTPKWWGTKAE